MFYYTANTFSRFKLIKSHSSLISSKLIASKWIKTTKWKREHYRKSESIDLGVNFCQASNFWQTLMIAMSNTFRRMGIYSNLNDLNQKFMKDFFLFTWKRKRSYSEKCSIRSRYFSGKGKRSYSEKCYTRCGCSFGKGKRSYSEKCSVRSRYSFGKGKRSY